MKKNSLAVMKGFLVAVVVVCMVSCSSSDKDANSGDTKFQSFDASDSTALLPIAYVNIDSLLTNYNYAKDANDVLMKKYNASTNTLNQKQRQLEGEIEEFQRKVKNNAFLSQERGEQESQRIQKLQADFQQMGQRMQNEFGMEQQKINTQIADSVRLCLKEYNKKANYHMILSNSGLDNILIAKEGYDITAKVLVMLNARYKPVAASK